MLCDHDPLVLSLVIGYRVFVALTGVAVIYLGYRLVQIGDGAASEIELGWGESRLKMSRATPGVVLMIVGAVVLVVNVIWGPRITDGYLDVLVPQEDVTAFRPLQGDTTYFPAEIRYGAEYWAP